MNCSSLDCELLDFVSPGETTTVEEEEEEFKEVEHSEGKTVTVMRMLGSIKHVRMTMR